MFEAIGRYGEYYRYEIELGKHFNIEDLTKGVVNRLNLIKPEGKIHIYVYDEVETTVGRIVDYREIGDCDPNVPMVYLDIEKYKKWAEHRRKSLNLR
jgi:hypothetical protein